MEYLASVLPSLCYDCYHTNLSNVLFCFSIRVEYTSSVEVNNNADMFFLNERNDDDKNDDDKNWFK